MTGIPAATPPQERSICYVVSRWGEPTQTFVRREAVAVSDLGIRVDAFSIKTPASTAGQVKVTHLGPAAIMGGVFKAFLRSPGLVLRLLLTVVRRSSIRNTPAQLAATLTGVAWAERGMNVAHIHCHFGWVSATATWAASKVAGVPFSVTLHAFELHTERLLDRFTRIPLGAASQVFCVSELDAAEASARFGLDVHVCRMGVPKEWMQEPLLSAASGDRSQDLIVSVGSLLPKKGHDELIRAVAKVKPWRLDIVGEGPQRSELQDLIGELEVGSRVRLLGHLPEESVRELLNTAALSVLACRTAPNGDRDGIPVALMEAMACGAPVATTRLGGIPELVEGVGVLINPEDRTSGIAAALSTLRDHETRDRLAELAQARIRRDWTVEGAAVVVASGAFDAAR